MKVRTMEKTRYNFTIVLSTFHHHTFVFSLCVCVCHDGANGTPYNTDNIKDDLWNSLDRNLNTRQGSYPT